MIFDFVGMLTYRYKQSYIQIELRAFGVYKYILFVQLTNRPYTMTDLLPFTQIEFIKIYIGQLPLNLEEQHLKEILQPLAELKEVKVVKGDNTRGRFDLFCYAFVTMKGNQAFAYDVIKKLQEKYPSWKMNVKFENDRQKMQRVNNKSYPPPVQMNYPQGNNMPYQQYPQPMQRTNFPNYGNHNNQNNRNQNSSNMMSGTQKIIGQKPCNIFVRELWIGGIPENFEKNYMAQIMSYYGIIEDIQIFPKFAFIKYKQVIEATIAFERAQEIYNRLGNPPGFRIFFSDPSRRAYIVSNHYQYDRQSPSIPILFIGFPPITSATVQMQVIKPVCEKFGVIMNEYMRKNTNTQNRSYFLFTFDNIKNAIRAKQELNKRKDLLGDKRAQVVLLIEEEKIMKDRDLSHTQKLFQNDMGNFDKSKKMSSGYYGDPHLKHGMPMQSIGFPPMYQNPMMYQNPYMPPFYGNQPPPYFYDQHFYKPPEEGQYQSNNHEKEQFHSKEDVNSNIHDFLQEVLADKTGNEKKPQKSSEKGREEDILSKLLGNQSKYTIQQKEKHHEIQIKDKGQERQPSWSGFLTWKGLKRVAVDGFSDFTELEDYAINIVNLIEFKDVIMKDKTVMVLESSNNISGGVFKQYIKQLSKKIGVGMNSKYLMYIMSKSPQSQQIEPINQNQLLVIFQKSSLLATIKDKLIKCQELL